MELFLRFWVWESWTVYCVLVWLHYSIWLFEGLIRQFHYWAGSGGKLEGTWELWSVIVSEWCGESAMITQHGSTRAATEEASFRVNEALWLWSFFFFFVHPEKPQTHCLFKDKNLSCPGLASSTDNIYTQTDVKSVYIYENQRWNPVTGYTNR